MTCLKYHSHGNWCISNFHSLFSETNQLACATNVSGFGPYIVSCCRFGWPIHVFCAGSDDAGSQGVSNHDIDYIEQNRIIRSSDVTVEENPPDVKSTRAIIVTLTRTWFFQFWYLAKFFVFITQEQVSAGMNCGNQHDWSDVSNASISSHIL